MRSSIAVLLITAVAVAGCGRKGARSSEFDSATAAALAAGVRPGSSGAANSKVTRATGFDIGHRIGRSGMIEGGTTLQFAPTDSILISVRATGVDSTHTISGRLRLKGSTIDSVAAAGVAPDTTGVSFVPLRFGSAKPWPVGTYQADIFIDGKFQMAQELSVSK